MHRTPHMLYTSSPTLPILSRSVYHSFKPSVDTSVPITQPVPFPLALFSNLVFQKVSVLLRPMLPVQSFHSTSSIEGPTYHTQQPPCRITRLRSNTKPVFCPGGIKFDIFPLFPFSVYWWFGNRVVCAYPLSACVLCLPHPSFLIQLRVF
jgi:hypothetical protein